MISAKYRYLHPSMVGKKDLNVSSNSDVGMSGSFVPFVELYDGFYFTPEHEPCDARYNFDKALVEDENISFRTTLDADDFAGYLYNLEHNDKFKDLLKYEKIEIVEKEPI